MSDQTKALHELLSELGLTTDETVIYSGRYSQGSLSAKGISETTNIIVNSVYRSTAELLRMGLVKELDTTPKQFQAVSPKLAISQLAERRIRKIQKVSASAIKKLGSKKKPNRLNMDLLTGREELFEQFVELARQAKKEILVISVGEEVPESIWSVTKEAIAKGASPKFIFHRNNKDNIMLIKRWQAMGVPVRHIPSEGYHLNIFDNYAAILSASNTKQSKERTGVVIYNEAIIEALRGYFSQQWGIAQRLGKET